MDSGATVHMVKNKEILTSYEAFDEPHQVKLGNNSICLAYGKGKFTLLCETLGSGRKKNKIKVSNVLYIPDLMCNFLSVKAITDNGNVVVFEGSRVKILSQNNEVASTASWNNRHCVLDGRAMGKEEELGSLSSADPQYEIWHRRYGHCSAERMKKSFNGGHVRGLPPISFSSAKDHVCEGCVQGKLKRQPFPKVTEICSKKPLDLIHSDVLGQ